MCVKPNYSSERQWLRYNYEYNLDSKREVYNRGNQDAKVIGLNSEGELGFGILGIDCKYCDYH